jgi:hypothetical protein
MQLHHKPKQFGKLFLSCYLFLCLPTEFPFRNYKKKEEKIANENTTV